MRALFFWIALCALPAHAELYRWIDPQTGSVKFSNLPPPWHGDAAKEARSPKVEMISAPPKPAPVAAEKPATLPPQAPVTQAEQRRADEERLKARREAPPR